jgi:hypothetical protein
VEIQLNSYKNINSVNVDSYNKLELTNKPIEITEYSINEVISATDIFDAEREVNPVYRIYGKIEYMSLLNGLKLNYNQFQDFFLPQTIDSKNILNSFDFYLVKPADTGYTSGTTVNAITKIVRYFQVIATPKEFEIFPIGFSNNVYGEQAYTFNFNVDFDVSNYFDNIGFPVNELFLYAQYKPTTIPYPIEGMKFTELHVDGTYTIKTYLLPYTLLNIGDFIKTRNEQKIGDLIEYNLPEFLQTQLSGQTIYIETMYFDGSTPKALIWKYNPFIPLRLRYFSDDLYTANTGSTSYEEVQSIPLYAKEIGDNTGNYVWREILPQGYSDPLTGIGVDYPFVNKKRYLFASIVFDVVPDLTDTNTLAAFKDVWFSRNATTVNYTPIGDINNIGKPCQ